MEENEFERFLDDLFSTPYKKKEKEVPQYKAPVKTGFHYWLEEGNSGTLKDYCEFIADNPEDVKILLDYFRLNYDLDHDSRG